MLEDECCEAERGADGDQVHEDGERGDDDAAEHHQQQQEGDDQDDADRVGGAVDEHAGEVVVLACGTADLRVGDRAVELAAKVGDHVGRRGVVDLGAGGDADHDATGRCG